MDYPGGKIGWFPFSWRLSPSATAADHHFPKRRGNAGHLRNAAGRVAVPPLGCGLSADLRSNDLLRPRDAERASDCDSSRALQFHARGANVVFARSESVFVTRRLRER